MIDLIFYCIYMGIFYSLNLIIHINHYINCTASMKAETKPLKRLPDSKSIYHCQRIFAQNKTIDNHQ